MFESSDVVVVAGEEECVVGLKSAGKCPCRVIVANRDGGELVANDLLK